MYTIIDYYIVAYTVMGIYIALKTRTPKSWSHMTVLTLKLVLFLSSWLYPAPSLNSRVVSHSDCLLSLSSMRKASGLMDQESTHILLCNILSSVISQWL